MRTVAQLALVTGANPLPGTNGIHAWVDHKGKLCIQFGMGFWRGKAEEAGGLIWKDRPRPMSDEEKVQWGIADGETGFICKGTTWDAVKRLRIDEKEMGGELSWKDAVDILYKEGIGVVSEDTYNYKDKTGYKEQKTGRALYWTASERAERDLLRKLVPIFQPGRNVHEWKGQTVMTATGAAKLASGPEWGTPEQFDKHSTNIDSLNDDLYASYEPEPTDADFEEEAAETQPPAANGNGKKPARPLSAVAVKEAMQKKTSGKGDKDPSEKQRKYAISSLSAVSTSDKHRHTITVYLFGKESTNDLTGPECSALMDWIAYKEVAPDDWQADPDAIQEAANIVRQDALDKGQQELFPAE
jgi:hypothetical protein